MNIQRSLTLAMIIKVCGPEHRNSFLGYLGYRKNWESSSMGEYTIYLTKKYNLIRIGDWLKDFPSNKYILVIGVEQLKNETVKILGYRINA